VFEQGVGPKVIYYHHIVNYLLMYSRIHSCVQLVTAYKVTAVILRHAASLATHLTYLLCVLLIGDTIIACTLR
jgi:hypothetical protein